MLLGPFVRNANTSAIPPVMLRVAMAPPWAAISWKAYLPKLYAGLDRPGFDGDRVTWVAWSLKLVVLMFLSASMSPRLRVGETSDQRFVLRSPPARF